MGFDPNGDIWVCTRTAGVFQRLNGVWQDAIAAPTGQTFLTGIAFDSNGDLWVCGTTPDEIYRRLNDVWQTGIAGPTGQTFLSAMRFEPAPVLPDAVAPGVEINAVADGGEGTTVQLAATITDGTYDELDYAWTVSGGTLDDDASATPTWTRPDVSADTDYDIDLTVTARGTGTTAADGTSADASAVTRAATVLPLLVLSDSDDTGLDVVAKALLVASAPGTAGNDPYADSDRGGTDTPLDGELGLGTTDTVISRFRRLVQAELTLNDNDNPAALNIGAYFNAGGDGNDLTIYLQTLADGVASFSAASQYILGGGGFARFTLPADAQTLLDNLASGDRWIFKAARPVAANAVNAGAAEWAFDVAEPSVDHNRAHEITAGAAAWAFAAAEPTILRGVTRAVDAGAASWAFAAAEPDTFRQRARDAGSASWAFAVPEPSVDHDRAHEITAGGASWAFAVAEPTVDHTARVLALADFVVPSGHVTVFAALITIGVSGEDRYNGDGGIGTLEDGDLEVAADVTIDRIRVEATRVRLTRIGAGSWRDYIQADDPLADARFHIQSDAGVSAVEVSDLDDTLDIFGNNVNIRDTITGGTAFIDRLTAVSSGGRIILAMTNPTAAFTVAAVAAEWAFTVPEPSVDHDRAHEITAGAVPHGPLRSSHAPRALRSMHVVLNGGSRHASPRYRRAASSASAQGPRRGPSTSQSRPLTTTAHTK